MTVTIEEYKDFLELREGEIETCEGETVPLWISVGREIGILTKERFEQYMGRKQDIDFSTDDWQQYYVDCDINEVTPGHRFVCYNKKQGEEKEWHMFSAIHFQTANKHFEQRHFYLPKDRFLPAFCYLDAEHVLMVAGAIYDITDPVDACHVSDADKIYDFAMDNGGDLQQGFDDWV